MILQKHKYLSKWMLCYEVVLNVIHLLRKFSIQLKIALT